MLLFNNRIYGLTKGQYSPTSEKGKITKSTPYGSLDQPVNPLKFAIASGATFVARTYDSNPKHMASIFKAAAEHKGVSFIEILQNCPIFNDGAWKNDTAKAARKERLLDLEHGKPMVFGAKDAPKGLRLVGTKIEVIELGGEFTEADCLVHDETDPILAAMLVRLDYPQYPVPLGVIYRVQRPTYDSLFNAQVDLAVTKQGPGELKDLLYGGTTWTVE